MMFLLMPQWQRDDGETVSHDTEWSCLWFALDKSLVEVKGLWAIQFPYYAECRNQDTRMMNTAPGPHNVGL